MTISSPHNDRLKEIRKLARRRSREQTGRFVAEGEDLLAAADAAGWPALERYCAAGSGLDGVEVEAELLAGVSQLGSGTRALAVYEQRWADAPAGPLCVALHGISDPGNVGTILRSALAFGASSVALGPDCADPYGSKAVRASMGAVFAVPLARIGRVAAEPDEGEGRSGSEGDGSSVGASSLVASLPGTTVALDAHGGEPLADAIAALDGLLTLVVGAERAGLPADLVAACDQIARIPIRSESLNAAMAATVALYEVTRGAVAAEHRMPPA
ncbi:MAG TPA: RNA methyltransferase [Conexibacter sp.]|nr:RNA methyltransferase [Conexibacter sp.]